MVTNLISKNYSKNKLLNRESMSKYLYLYFTDVQIPNHEYSTEVWVLVLLRGLKVVRFGAERDRQAGPKIG